jgi:DNA replication protein DnaC
MEPIEDAIKRITEATSMTKKTDPSPKETMSPGKEVCPICGGIGYVRRDRPIDDPEFGTLEVCECQLAKKRQASEARLFQISNLNAYENMIFDTFDMHGLDGRKQTNTTLEVAFNTAQNYSHKLNGWLLIMGDFGCGKTHLAAAIANEVVAHNIETLFLTVPDLLDWLRFTYSSKETTYEERFEEIRNIRFLVLDDLGTQNATPWAREKLFQIINFRYIHQLPTVITTNLEMTQIEDRISSRLQDRKLVIKLQIDASDYRNPLGADEVTPISSITQISSHRTFEKFSIRADENLRKDERKSLEEAFYAAQKFADNPKGWLIFKGGLATGKTHLAAAISHYRAAMGDEPIFTVVPDLLDHLRATFSPTSTVSYDSIFNQVRTAKLLILDDLGTQNATPWAKEKLYQIINYRYESGMPTIITTSEHSKDIDPRILSRMNDKRISRIIPIIVPPYQAQ